MTTGDDVRSMIFGQMLSTQPLLRSLPTGVGVTRSTTSLPSMIWPSLSSEPAALDINNGDKSPGSSSMAILQSSPLRLKEHRGDVLSPLNSLLVSGILLHSIGANSSMESPASCSTIPACAPIGCARSKDGSCQQCPECSS